jgi:hypothetical protein
MSSQLAIFAPTPYGERPAEPFEARLIHRKDDPATSKRAALRLVRTGQLDGARALFLRLLRTHGPLTHKEAAARTDRPDHFRTEFDKRVKRWAVAGVIALTGEERDGARVWRARP